MTHNASAADEQRVLDELEQLQVAIRIARERRERAQADFSAHLGAFGSATRGAPSGGAGAAGAHHAQEGSFPQAPEVVTLHVGDMSRLFADEAIPQVPRTAAGGPPPASGSRPGLMPIAAAAFLLAAGLGWFLLRASPNPASDPAERRPRSEAIVAAAPALPSPPPAAPAVDPHPLRIDITTLRRVWMRVVVDGRIAIERELPAGERLPFGADKSIVIRAGDAGAVSVRVGNDDQGPLGRDGQVVTREFAAPAR